MFLCVFTLPRHVSQNFIYTIKGESGKESGRVESTCFCLVLWNYLSYHNIAHARALAPFFKWGYICLNPNEAMGILPNGIPKTDKSQHSWHAQHVPSPTW